jgi:hypothetical protein
MNPQGELAIESDLVASFSSWMDKKQLTTQTAMRIYFVVTLHGRLIYS